MIFKHLFQGDSSPCPSANPEDSGSGPQPCPVRGGGAACGPGRDSLSASSEPAAAPGHCGACGRPPSLPPPPPRWRTAGHCSRTDNKALKLPVGERLAAGESLDPVEHWWPGGGAQRWRGSDRPSAAAPWSWRCCCRGAERRGRELCRLCYLCSSVISAVLTGVRKWEEGAGSSPAAQPSCGTAAAGAAPHEGPRCSFVRAESLCRSPIRSFPDQATQGREPLTECKESQKTPTGKKGKLYSCGGNNNCTAAWRSSHSTFPGFPDGAAGGGSRQVATAALPADRAPVQQVPVWAGATANRGTGLPGCRIGGTQGSPPAPTFPLLPLCKAKPQQPCCILPLPCTQGPSLPGGPKRKQHCFPCAALPHHPPPPPQHRDACRKHSRCPRGCAPLLAAC